MSLAIMFYKQPNRMRRLSDAASQAQTAENADRAFAGQTRIDRTRSIGFPIVVLIATLVLIVSFFHSATASANNSEQKLLCHSVDSASVVVLGKTSVKNIGTERAVVMCAIDMAPSVSTVTASIRLENSSDTIPSRCTFYARSAFGGQARGVPLQTATHSRDTADGWLGAASLDTAMDDFRYVSCELAPGSAITGLRATARKTTVAQRPLASRNSRNTSKLAQDAFVTLR